MSAPGGCVARGRCPAIGRMPSSARTWRLGRPRAESGTAPPADVPSGVATRDVPGAVTIVVGGAETVMSTLLRAAAAIAREATARRAAALRIAGFAWDDGLWEAAGTAPGSRWSDDETHSERQAPVDDTHSYGDWVTTRLAERAPRPDVNDTVLSTRLSVAGHRRVASALAAVDAAVPVTTSGSAAHAGCVRRTAPASRRDAVRRGT